MPCCVKLCCEECPATDVHSVLRCVILSRNVAQNDDGLRTETCQSAFNALMCKFYTFLYVQWLM